MNLALAPFDIVCLVPLKLTEEQRYEIANKTIREMRRYGAYKDLDDPVEPMHAGPSWIDGKPP